ncbi:hypothetical protein HOU03_gp353 [Caulobacter phage CcrSC]|uniref:Uncharacterized protein n=1 Tax=Caulobacter phage CcrSC TaxID=2283272 RepID=A0A385EFT2_9CAUD|nr:hypothetical protein HOU03_gp353 [Caulobacter phage CcrSC]AXQ69915.1 hypothetical protein CcrSC_gp333 [Caulobacter phage CcrSC]
MLTNRVPDFMLDPVTGVGPTIKQRMAERLRIRQDLEREHPGWKVQSTVESRSGGIEAVMFKDGETFPKRVHWDRAAYLGRQFLLPFN